MYCETRWLFAKGLGCFLLGIPLIGFESLIRHGSEGYFGGETETDGCLGLVFDPDLEHMDSPGLHEGKLNYK